MRSDTKNLILIVLALVVVIAGLYVIITATQVFVSKTPITTEEDSQISEPDVDTEEALGVVRRITEPSTGRITGYDARGVVAETNAVENTLTLSVSENEGETLVVSLGADADMIGFLDKRSASSVRDGLIEKNTYTSDTASSIFGQVVVGQTVLVHIPVWVDTPDSSRCDGGCMERVEALRARGEDYTPILEEIIYTSAYETNAVFTISMLEIEN